MSEAINTATKMVNSHSFDPSTIKILKDKSFDGWPPIKQISFGKDFGFTLSFCISPNAQIDCLDFSL